MVRHEGSGLGWAGGAGARGQGGTRASGNLMFPKTSCFNWKASLSLRGGCPATTPQGEESVRAPIGKLLETRSKNGYSGFTGKEKRKGGDLMLLKAGSLFKENYCCCSEFKSGAEQSSRKGGVPFQGLVFLSREEAWGWHLTNRPSFLPQIFVEHLLRARLRAGCWGPSREQGRRGPCYGDVLATMKTDKGVLYLIWGSGSLPGGSGLSGGTRRRRGVSQKKRLRRVLQVERTALAEAQK